MNSLTQWCSATAFHALRLFTLTKRDTVHSHASSRLARHSKPQNKHNPVQVQKKCKSIINVYSYGYSVYFPIKAVIVGIGRLFKFYSMQYRCEEQAIMLPSHVS